MKTNPKKERIAVHVVQRNRDFSSIIHANTLKRAHNWRRQHCVVFWLPLPPPLHPPGPARQPSDPANSPGRLERDAAPFQSLEPERLHSGPSDRAALARSRSAPLHCGNMTASIRRRGGSLSGYCQGQPVTKKFPWKRCDLTAQSRKEERKKFSEATDSRIDISGEVEPQNPHFIPYHEVVTQMYPAKIKALAHFSIMLSE